MEYRRILVSLLTALFLPVPTSAQLQTRALEQFRNSNPNARIYGAQFYQPVSESDEAGGMTSVYGTILSTGKTAEESAWNHVDDVRGMLGAEIGTLVPEIKSDGSFLQGVMYNQRTQNHKFYTLRFNQYFHNLPVFRSGAGFLVRNQDGYPLVMSGFTVKNLAVAPIALPDDRDVPSVSRRMLRNVNRLMDDQPVERSVLDGNRAAPMRVVTEKEKFVIFAGANGRFAVPELAVQFEATRGSLRTVPDYHKYMIVASASTGEILHEETLICHCAKCRVDINGKIEGRATQGLDALECDPEAAMPLPYAEVNVVGGNSTFADANGNFNIPHGGTGQVTVRSRLRGRYFEVFDEANGSAIPELTLSVTPPGPANFLHNPGTTDDLMTANVNCYVEANRARDFVLSYEPTFPVINSQQFFDINTNINASCNAFYNGSSINFYQNGNGCNNTAISDVIHHEYGHHLINVSNNGQGQMGEGSGDVIGVLIQDEPVLGQGFRTCGIGIRNANNNKQYPCSGEIHDCGQLISGCVWSTRNELIVTEPADYLDISASLFIGMLIVRGQMDPGQNQIAPDITVIYLELDDDDTEIGNGTPHYDEIDAGFSAHNMDPPPINLIGFEYPDGRPDLVPHTGGPGFLVRAVTLIEDPDPDTGILHVDTGDGSGFQQYPMHQISPNLYEASFPASICGSVIEYYVSAETSSGATQFNPNDAPETSYTAFSGNSIANVLTDDGETDPGWTVTGDAADGQWDRGTPAGFGDRGDPADDGDGSGQCWLTDNVDGNSDVDGGSTILTSPVMNATPGTNETALISYRRWYSNNFGNAPENDIFVVDISDDGGATWTNLETVGPTGAEVRGGWIEKFFRIGDFVTPNNQIRLRFTASDLNDGSVVEAGVDGIEINMVTCVHPVDPDGRKFLDGVVVSGSLSDVYESDDVDYALDPSPTSNPFKQKIDMIVIAESPVASPSSFGFVLESSMIGGPAGDVKQTIRLWNFQSSSWELLDLREATTADSVVSPSATGDLTRFVHPINSEILARVTWESPDFSGSTFNWSVDIDRAGWPVGQ